MLRWSFRRVNVQSCFSGKRMSTECFLYTQYNTLYTYRGTHEPLDDPRCAKDFVLSLKPSERIMVCKKLDEVLQQSKVIIVKFESHIL